MKVGIFYNSISNPAKFSNKVMLMNNFKLGVQTVGDQIIDYHGNTLPDQQLDAGFVLGYTLEDNFRKKIIDQLRQRSIPQMFVDSNILHYSRKEHEWHRYSLNSVYPDSGIYFFKELDRTKWQKYSQWHGVQERPWRSVGNHILIFCQRPKGWNMFGVNQEEWLDQTIEKIRAVCNRPIVVRMHPGDGTRVKQIEKLQKKYGTTITISSKENIRDDLIDCWATVGFNSTPNVVAAIEGVPTYLADPTHSWAKDIAFTDINQIAMPPKPDRSEWLHKIANIHWSNDEVKSGLLWSAVKQHILSSRS